MAILPTSESLAKQFNKGGQSPNIPAILMRQGQGYGFQSYLADRLDGHEVRVQSDPPATLEEAKAIKIGLLNRTKLTEAGKRLRKNWAPGLIAISDDYLILFKETKTLPGSANKPEMAIELAGALVEWSPDKSSRKNVFKVTTVTGHQVLLQDDCSLTCKEWFDAIRTAIMRLPSKLDIVERGVLEKGDDASMVAMASGKKEGSKLKRSKSQKQFSPSKAADGQHGDKDMAMTEEMICGQLGPLPAEKRKRITERLRQFLRRRPTLESLREKGIFKVG